ncbi:unnamed protein product [Alopecurus aequalis]
MSSSSTLLSLLLLVASSSVWGMARPGGGLVQLEMYMYEYAKVTVFDVSPPFVGASTQSTTFGIERMFDNELRDGPYPSNSTIFGRFQGFMAFTGNAGLPGKNTLVTFVFTSGRYSGSTLVIAGIVQLIDGTIERAVVGGTGSFRMARGYSLISTVWSPTPNSTVFKVKLFLKLEKANLLMKMTDA